MHEMIGGVRAFLLIAEAMVVHCRGNRVKISMHSAKPSGRKPGYFSLYRGKKLLYKSESSSRGEAALELLQQVFKGEYPKHVKEDCPVCQSLCAWALKEAIALNIFQFLNESRRSSRPPTPMDKLDIN